MTLAYVGLAALIQGELRQAVAAFREALTLLDEFAEIEGLSATLADMASLAQELGQCESAARLLGAASAMNEVLGLRDQLPERLVHERTEAELRAVLGPTAFARAWEERRLMTREQAIAEAFAVIDRAPAAVGGLCNTL